MWNIPAEDTAVVLLSSYRLIRAGELHRIVKTDMFQRNISVTGQFTSNLLHFKYNSAIIVNNIRIHRNQ